MLYSPAPGHGDDGGQPSNGGDGEAHRCQQHVDEVFAVQLPTEDERDEMAACRARGPTATSALSGVAVLRLADELGDAPPVARPGEDDAPRP
jgi:hypothetical protein